MIGSTMLTYALYTGMLRDAGFKANTVTRFRDADMTSIEDPDRSLRVETKLETNDRIKSSPLYPDWVFTHVSNAYGQASAKDGLLLKFRTYAQDGNRIETVGHSANRLLLRLWDYSLSRMKRDHKVPYDWVDVYLCENGKAGGEHTLTSDPDDLDSGKLQRKASVIHIFEIGTLTSKMELVRELAHEYGHANFPGVATFESPESWGNGYAGERIFIKWLYEDLQAKKITTEDTMGATEDDLAGYLAKKVDPLVKQMAVNGPNEKLLGASSEAAFNEYLALNSYAEAILPRNVYARAATLGESDAGATTFLRSIVEASAEREELPLRIPANLKGQTLWIPLGKGTIKGAKVVTKKGSWAKVQPTSQTVIIVNPPLD